MKLLNIKEKNLIVHFIATNPGTQIPDEPGFGGLAEAGPIQETLCVFLGGWHLSTAE
jgi:hypothetical protein